MVAESRFIVRADDRPVIDQHDPGDPHWTGAGGDPRDEGRMIELISRRITGSQSMLVGLAWLSPGETHLLHHHPNADEWYYVISGSSTFTVADETARAGPGTAIFTPAGTPHRIDNDGDETLFFAWGFNRSELSEVGIVWDE